MAAAQAAWEKKGERISLLRIAALSNVADYMLIITGFSKIHLDALQAAISKAAERLGLACLRRSGARSECWRVLDFGGLLVHLMTAPSREFYSLEKLYHGAPRIQWKTNGSQARGTSKTGG
jgi:ribosome-associated protein